MKDTKSVQKIDISILKYQNDFYVEQLSNTIVSDRLSTYNNLDWYHHIFLSILIHPCGPKSCYFIPFSWCGHKWHQSDRLWRVAMWHHMLLCKAPPHGEYSPINLFSWVDIDENTKGAKVIGCEENNATYGSE